MKKTLNDKGQTLKLTTLGFTLIELLAVIIVLGVIVVIIAPNFTKTLSAINESGYGDSLMGVVRAVTQDSAENEYERSVYEVNEGILTYQGRKISYKGEVSGSGIVQIDLRGNVMLDIKDDEYCGIKAYKASEITVREINNCPKLADSSGAAVPELAANMHPVVWNASKSAWVIADTENYEESEWYNYDERRWANAVTVTPAKRENYRKAKVGEVVNQADIIGFFVWIPRFQYKDFSTIGAPTTIDVTFETSLDTRSSNITHPAFHFGGKKLSGFWVGKFETTGTVDQPTILPNTTPLTGESLDAYFTSARNLNLLATARHGFNEKKTNAHVMKNSEWGAVAYLSHSKYGTNKEITVNASTLTGGGTYETSPNQSTTGTIYGVYDMSGGVYEYVMGNNLGELGNSNMTELPENKYYDYYASTNEFDYAKGITGDATKELAPFTSGASAWYKDSAFMVRSTQPWFVRGGYRTEGTKAGIFAFTAKDGSFQDNIGYRIVVDAY